MTPGPATAAFGSDDRAELADLAARYALLADERDLDGLTALFTPDGVLVLPDPPGELEPVLRHEGPGAIGRALSALRAVPMTFHALAGHVFDAGPEPGTATGRVACAAHHLTDRADGTSDLVWHLRYRDGYRRAADGGWRIARREVRIDWIETRHVRVRRATGPESGER